MRKFFTTLKSVVAASVIAAMTLAASCSTYDDQPLNDRLDKVEKDLTALTERVAALEKKLGEEVDALKSLIDGKTVVTEVTTDADGNTTIKLSDGKEITVLAPTDPCACDPLEYRVVDGVLEVSADGENWIPVQVAPECVVADAVVNDDNTVTITLANGEEFTVVKAELVEFNTTRGQIFVQPNQTIEITFTINDAVADVNVMNQPLGWKATIEPKVADEEAGEGDENVDPGMGILAAGGTEFVLKVTGPTQEFINAGYAEKEGVISVHFNSESGACKVGKIAVELASIVLDVDKAGNVTITNTWVDSYEYEDWGNIVQVQEFNNYYVTIMPIEYYTEDLTSIWNASWWEWNVPAVGGWINNFFYNVNEEYNTYEKNAYQEGVNEEWIFKASVEEIISVLDWDHSLTYEGNSFAVIVTPTDPHSYSSLKIEESQVAFFKQLNVNVECLETSWNAAYFNATLRGGNAYHFNINKKAELQLQIDNGWYDGFEGYYNDYIYYWQQYGSQFGEYTLYTDLQQENIEFSEMLNWGEDYPLPYELTPNTEYIVAILVEEDGKTEYTYNDLKIFEFTTKDINPAATPFEYTITRDDENCTYFNIYADITVPETTVAAYSAWVDEAFLEDDTYIKDYLLNNGWCNNDFAEDSMYTYTVNTYANNAGHVKYLYLMMVDAEGNYTIGMKELASNEVVYNETVNVTIDEVVFYTSERVAEVTLGGLEGVEYTSIKAYVFPRGGDSYYERTEEQLQDLAYGSDWLYKGYKTNPIEVTQTADYKYAAVEGTTYFVAVAVNFADGTVSKTVCGEFTFGEAAPVEPATPDYEVAFTAVEYHGEATDYYTTYSQFKFTNEAGNWMVLAMHPNDVVDGLLPVGEFPINWTNQGEVYGNATMISKELFTSMTYDPYITSGKVVISKEGDVYTVVVNGENLYLDGASGKTLKATFEGTMTAAGGDDTGNEGGDDSGTTVAEDSLTYLGRYYELDDDDSTSDGGYMFKAVAGGVEYTIELYWAYANAEGAIKVGTYDYIDNQADVMYSGQDGFCIISDSYYYGSTLAVTADGVATLTLKDADSNLIGEYTYENVAVFE